MGIVTLVSFYSVLFDALFRLSRFLLMHFDNAFVVAAVPVMDSNAAVLFCSQRMAQLIRSL